jgi:osmotically-inducible protein OsmY
MFKQHQAPAITGEPLATAAASVSQEVIDARHEAQIWTTYALSPFLRASDLKVIVRDNIATITGCVAEDFSKDLAKQLALGVDGITSVDNRIEIVIGYIATVNSTTRAFGEVVDDTTLTSAVRSKLAWSRFADGLIVDVSSARGKVSLSGSATTEEGKEGAGKLAMSTHGVRSVNNQLVVQANNPGVVTSIGNDIADTWITTKVKSTFMYSIGAVSSDVSVTTQAGVVSLSGKVDSGLERSLAIELAGNVRGVKGVDSTALMM